MHIVEPATKTRCDNVALQGRHCKMDISQGMHIRARTICFVVALFVFVTASTVGRADVPQSNMCLVWNAHQPYSMPTAGGVLSQLGQYGYEVVSYVEGSRYSLPYSCTVPLFYQTISGDAVSGTTSDHTGKGVVKCRTSSGGSLRSPPAIRIHPLPGMEDMSRSRCRCLARPPLRLFLARTSHPSLRGGLQPDAAIL